MPRLPLNPLSLLFALALALEASACQTFVRSRATTGEMALLIQVNNTINRLGRSCAGDVCLAHWPDATDVEKLAAWDCKAYAVAKANRLMVNHGYDPARLEYVLIEGAPLRVTHAALLVDGRWVMDSGLRCQVCALDEFAAGLRVTGRLPVAELPYLDRALQAEQER